AERMPHHRQVDLLALERLQVVAAASHDVHDAELAVVEAVLLNRGRELEPRDGAGPDPDPLRGDPGPALDVLALADQQAVVAGADPGHPDHRLRALAEAQDDVLRTERGDIEVARG